jgi:hypothetical protein
LPDVSGETKCDDTADATCKTFNQHDALHITKTMGWNFIRLGVSWAGTCYLLPAVCNLGNTLPQVHSPPLIQFWTRHG